MKHNEAEIQLFNAEIEGMRTLVVNIIQERFFTMINILNQLIANESVETTQKSSYKPLDELLSQMPKNCGELSINNIKKAK